MAVVMLAGVESADRASGAYDLVGPLDVQTSSRRKWMDALQIIGGHAPSASEVEFQVVDRESGRVVYRATTRNALSEQAWQEKLTQDLQTLSKAEFDREWGIEASS